MPPDARGHWLFEKTFGQPVVKDGCGVFGVLRKRNAEKIPSMVAVEGISCVKYRGSDLGAGYASFNAGNGGSDLPFRIGAFVRDQGVVSTIKDELSAVGEVKDEEYRGPVRGQFRLGSWHAALFPAKRRQVDLAQHVDNINRTLISATSIEGRIFSYGKFVKVYKEVGYPLDVAKLYGLDGKAEVGDLWLAHTRQPTNSPGSFPIWSHPFASTDCAIVHNGDISSFGSNMELLGSWGATSHVGTDSEVIARLLDHLIRVEGLSVVEAATVLTNPYQRRLSRELLELLAKYRGARLDGPFAVIAGYSDGSDTYLVALTDRSKFRPILIGEDDGCYYVASEENQIRNISREAKIWTPEPGSFFIASVNRGIVESGSGRSLETQDSVLRESANRFGERKPESRFLDATGLDFKAINARIVTALANGEREITFENVSGQRYSGIGSSTLRGGERHSFKVILRGYPGNCLANLNDGVDFEVFGNVSDDMADTMHGGSVVVHGNVRDVACQALQGGRTFIRGTAGNRLAIQMREYKHARPFVVLGETADDYLGEYMAGGVVVVLDLSGSGKPVLNYVGTGMVGGSIYVRGRVEDSQIGLLPQREDVLSYIKTEMIDGNISQRTYDKVAGSEFPSEALLSQVLPPEILSRVKALFFSSKYVKHVDVRRGRLSSSDLQLVSENIKQFFATFNLPATLLDEVLSSEFTVIRAREEKKVSPLPPQEVPVEE